MSAARNKSGGSQGGGFGSDQRLIVILLAVMLVLIVGVSVLAPQQAEIGQAGAGETQAQQTVSPAGPGASQARVALKLNT